MADFLNQLYTPVGSQQGSQQGAGNVWGGGGFTPGAQQAASYFGAQPGAGAPNMPIGTGTTMYDPMQQEDIRNVGITSTDQNALETYIPEAADPLEEQTNMFSDAYNKGYTATQDVSGTGGYGEKGINMAVGGNMAHSQVIGRLGMKNILGHNKGDTFEKGTMEAARHAKRDDRESDQQVYQKAQKEIKADLIAGGMKKGKARRQARRAKRQLRRGMRRTRKDAWKSFKGDQKLKRQDDAYAYEQKYS